MKQNELWKIEEFLVKFLLKPESVIERKWLGLCYNFCLYTVNSPFSSYVLTDLIFVVYQTRYPINDETSDMTAEEQHNNTRLYEGNQLKLRKQLALDLLNKLENGTISKRTKVK